MSCDKQDFRNAMALLGSAVNVITTNGPAGKCGYTGTAVCSLTDTPATLLACLNKNSQMNKVFGENGALCINVLTGRQQDLSNLFAGIDNVPMPRRFETAEWFEMETGSPVNSSALCALDCRIVSSQDHGTHTMFFCEVQKIHFGSDDDGLIYWGRQYYNLETREQTT